MADMSENQAMAMSVGQDKATQEIVKVYDAKVGVYTGWPQNFDRSGGASKKTLGPADKTPFG